MNFKWQIYTEKPSVAKEWKDLGFKYFVILATHLTALGLNSLICKIKKLDCRTAMEVPLCSKSSTFMQVLIFKAWRGIGTVK